ncbi:hypothetical protein [Chryseobacterium flavum]|uniref:hypothetical protein n=1 Tax=Chryseobacterium flavum TaxID=415851 RepID=UPI0028AB91CA|nr:hypothetical protein [Chryseobacterium flavum]
MNFTKTENLTKLMVKNSKKILLGTRYGNNQDDIYKLFGEKFFQVTDKEKLVKLINVVNEIGPVEEYNLAKWETMVVKGSNARSQYFFKYNVKETLKKQKNLSP